MTASQLTIGALVQVKRSNGWADFEGMTGTIIRVTGGFALVTFTA
jgi:hypothetical protein